MSEKRLVRAKGQALSSPNTGLTGPRRAVHHPALHSRIDYFFGPELGLYQNSLASQHSILEHVSICSPSQFVHLHGKPHRLFFRAGARTESHKRDICSPFCIYRRASACCRPFEPDLSVRAIAYEKASSLLSVGSLEQFWNAITLELRASWLAGGLHFLFFYGCLVLHGLY